MAVNDRRQLKKLLQKANSYGIASISQLITFLDVAEAGHEVTYTQLAGIDDSQAEEVKRVATALRKIGPGYDRGKHGYSEGLDLVTITPGAVPPSGLRGAKASTGVQLSTRGKRLDNQFRTLMNP